MVSPDLVSVKTNRGRFNDIACDNQTMFGNMCTNMMSSISMVKNR
ncbi:hypothetical protein SAMN05216388_104810 [Halorientalis persicus]|uniref:Uncharacterized protein n=1 Tax=Halorientalis persicus TaxID=1367881 RepID=A0A1H8W4W7_9EURY|nr:hypothetical protein SAMN05216388_104810 [Halorientalis persicus]